MVGVLIEAIKVVWLIVGLLVGILTLAIIICQIRHIK